MDSGYFQLARIETLNQNWEASLEVIDRSLIRNWHNHKARQLKTSILRHLGRKEQALALIEESLPLDQFNFSMYFEKYLLTNDEAALVEMKALIRGNIHNYIEFALDYGWAGLYDEAIRFITIGIEDQTGDIYPLALYYKAWFQSRMGQETAAKETLDGALKQSPDYCFPNQTEAVVALQWASSINPEDHKALYYLGNFWYAFKNYDEAVTCWEKSVAIDPEFPTTHRNLSLAYFNKQNDAEKALNSLEKAFELDQTDARVLMELDQLYKRLNHSLESRLENLIRFRSLVDQRDDLYLELATLYNLNGKYEKAYDLLMSRQFHPWEGGEGKVTGQYVISLTGMARQAIGANHYDKAVELLSKARNYPHNLGEGKLHGAQENELLYLLGLAYEGLHNADMAKAFYVEASQGLSQVSSAMFYNDQQPDTIFYQGLALMKLGCNEEAKKRFGLLIEYGEAHQNDYIKIDYFAVSLPDLLIWEDDLSMRNRQLCWYLMGLAYLGNGNRTKAKHLFELILNSDCSHKAALVYSYFK